MAQPKALESYVGFANLPNQLYRKSVKQGFEFTLMVVGESGLGKSTLINSLFLSELYSDVYPGPSHRIQKTVKVETTKIMLREHGVSLKLTVCDTPGFGDAVNNNNCWEPVINHIESKFEDYLNAESEVQRTTLTDNRVHCCLYFIAPTGHGLKPLDIEFMKQLHDKVNIIPLIAKADTMTPEECAQFKLQIKKEIEENSIRIYEFPENDQDQDDENPNCRVPFAVVGSNTVIEKDGKKVRGRKYPWGIAEVENIDHCDFTVLRDMLIRTHMQDLKDVTNNVHYENFRSKKLSSVTTTDTSSANDKSPIGILQDEKAAHMIKMRKMENEMEDVFRQKVDEKRKKLIDSEADLARRHEAMKKKLENEYHLLEERRKKFEQDKMEFEREQEKVREEMKKNEQNTRTLGRRKKW